MKIFENGNKTIAIVESITTINSTSDLLDIIATAIYNYGCIGIIVPKESLNANFFDLKTGVAGELLQKCSNYQMKLAVVGDFSEYTSKSLKDFIYECNKGNLVFFKSNQEQAIEALTC